MYIYIFIINYNIKIYNLLNIIKHMGMVIIFEVITMVISSDFGIVNTNNWSCHFNG